jgi:hypothetical protein
VFTCPEDIAICEEILQGHGDGKEAADWGLKATR